MAHQLPITNKDISKQIGRTIKAPILVSNLTQLGVNQSTFIEQFSPFFEELSWDPYDARRMRVELLIKHFPSEKEAIESRFKEYYMGRIPLSEFDPWIAKLPKDIVEQFQAIQPWRRRSIAQFYLERKGEEVVVTREPVAQFSQQVEEDDVRSWPRLFDESPAKHVENDLFYDLMKAVYWHVCQQHQIAYSIRMTAHFMSVKATHGKPGDNSPEGAHEDGADYIISALVINRKNLTGGETQIIEKQLPDGPKEIIFQHILQPGEFVFQSDTGDEDYFGTDLWHHVTPFYIADPDRGEGWRDIIGFDIQVVKLA